MSRTKLVVALLIVIVLGAAFGWFLQQWWDGAPSVSPVEVGEPAAPSVKTASKAGFCCVTLGKGCLAADNAGMCFRSGGKAFNAVKNNCDYYCSNVKP